LNVKKIQFSATKKSDQIEVEMDTNLTSALAKEGKIRDLVRQIQELRKKSGVSQDEYILLTIPHEYKSYESFIQKRVLAREVTYGDEVQVHRSV